MTLDAGGQAAALVQDLVRTVDDLPSQPSWQLLHQLFAAALLADGARCAAPLSPRQPAQFEQVRG